MLLEGPMFVTVVCWIRSDVALNDFGELLAAIEEPER